MLLLDEPLGAFDLKLREHMKIELKLLQQQFGTTFVYINHDQSEALVMSDKVAVMNAGQFEQVGTPQELYHHPSTAFVAGFVGDNNRLAGTVVVLGQFSFIAAISTLVIAARLRKFDRSLEEAALNLGATPTVALFTIIMPFLRPAMVGSAIVAFLISFEKFNTTLILNGSNAPLTITMFDRMREGSTPVLNAVSLTLMFGSGLLGLLGVLAQRDRSQT